MEISDNIKIEDLGLVIDNKILVVGDFHIGYEEYLNKQGIFIPRFQIKDVKRRLKLILDKIKPKIIVINGDLKHEFGNISKQEWNDISELLNLMSEYGKIILIQGNHDPILEPIANKKNLDLKKYFVQGFVTIAINLEKNLKSA